MPDQLWFLAASAWDARRKPGDGPAPVLSASAYAVATGVAQIEVCGVIAAGDPFWWGRMCDPAQLAAAIRAADADPAVTEIRLIVNSPGGSGGAMRDAHLALRAATKPTTAYVTDQALSAGYWIAVGCDRIVAHPLAMIGCIGTVARGADYRAPGDVRKVIRSSQTPRKAPDVASEDFDAQWQAVCDEGTRLFLADIAAGRGWPTGDLDAVAERIGRGAFMAAPAALAAGLIDAIADTPAGVASTTPPLVDGTPQMKPGASAGARQQGAKHMDPEVEKLTKERDELAAKVAELEAELAKMREKDAAAVEAEAAAEEDKPAMAAALARVAALEAALVEQKRDRYIEARLHARDLLPAQRAAVVKLYALGGEALVEDAFPRGVKRLPDPVGHGHTIADAGQTSEWASLNSAAAARVEAAEKAGQRLTYDVAVRQELAARRK
ncbi:MAG: hypothetical protein EKK55_24285 [Rhodocyclaceae bacterium]|nr:MAG: hypothetical protein EKK55_24285 [Rhodocyclaceae bacterium]